MRKTSLHLAISTLISTSATGFTSVSQAQGKSLGLEEIVVTAQRRSESLQDAAIPINAASGADLERLGVASAADLNKVAPSLTVRTGGGANTAYFIRGVGNFTNNGYTAPAVAFNIDGVYIGRPSSTISSFLDLNRVEVLKGPQGTLYGRNSTGGAINVIPNAPVLGENSGRIQVGFGNYSAYDVTGIGNFSVSDTTAVRLAGVVSEHDGYNNDGTFDADDVALRGQVYTESSDSLNVRLSADYSTQKGVGPGAHVEGHYAFTPYAPNTETGNWTFNPVPDALSDPFKGLHDPAVLDYIGDNVASAPSFVPYEGFAYPFRDDSYWGINAEINADLGWADLVVIPAYRVSELDNQFNGPPFKAAINQDEAKQSSIEARLSGETESLEWILGAYYFDENVKGVNSFNQFSTATHNSWETDVESTALFARVSFSLTEQLRLVGGVRYTDETRSIDGEGTSTALVCLEEAEGRPPFCGDIPDLTTLPVGLTLQDTLAGMDPALFAGAPRSPFDGGPVVGGYPFAFNFFAPQQFGPAAVLAVTPSTFDESDGDEEITYRVAMEYDLTPDNLLYASFETGFRAGGFNLAIGRGTYEPEFIDAYTIGSKNRFMDDRLEINFEAFYWEYEDQQLAALGLDTLGNNAFYTRNVGASTIKGAEVDFQFAATENTLVRGSVQLLDATYDSFVFTQVDLSDEGIDPPNFLTPVNGCVNTQVMFQGDTVIPFDPALNVADPTDGIERGFTVDCSGEDALNAPELTFAAGIQHTMNFDNLELIFNLDGRYRADRELGFNYLPEGRADSDFTADATITLRHQGGSWGVNAYVRNLTDEEVGSTYQLGAGNVVGSVYEPPRTYGVRFSYNF